MNTNHVLTKSWRPKGSFPRYRPLTRVVDIRTGEIGVFQTRYRRLDVAMGQVRFSAGRTIPVPMRFLKMARHGGRTKGQKATDQANMAYKRLLEKHGWDRDQCDRVAEQYGLTVVQIVDALED